MKDATRRRLENLEAGAAERRGPKMIFPLPGESQVDFWARFHAAPPEVQKLRLMPYKPGSRFDHARGEYVRVGEP